MNLLLKHYSRKDIQKAILKVSENREVAVRFGDKGYGKRPDILQFENDVYELARKGATSFHISEERWANPLLIKTGMNRRELDSLRLGWELILDVDGVNLEYSKLATNYLIEALKFFDIKNISVKFSGNKGMHIAIPFETFPKKIDQIEIKNYFPEGPRIIADYLKNMIKEHLVHAILEKESVNEIADKLNKPKEALIKNNSFDPFALVNIDTILISSRHLFRSPYSYNEKSGLISIPVKLNNVLNFNIEEAKIENVEVNLKFLDLEDIKEAEAADLFDKALYSNLKNKKQEEDKIIKNKTYALPEKVIDELYFPPCMKLISNGIKGDGRKRALFILLNFLKNIGYKNDEIEKYVYEWNKKNYEPLRENYVKAQLTWHKRQEKNILPQNCPQREDNLPILNQQNIYIDLGVCKPDDFCKLIKNPVNYATRKQRLFAKK